MSRSYKHFPYSGDTKGKKKRLANHSVRQALRRRDSSFLRGLDRGNDMPGYRYMAYKRLYESSDVSGLRSYIPWEAFRESEREISAASGRQGLGTNEKAEEEAWKRWSKYYYRK